MGEDGLCLFLGIGAGENRKEMRNKSGKFVVVDWRSSLAGNVGGGLHVP